MDHITHHHHPTDPPGPGDELAGLARQAEIAVRRLTHLTISSPDLTPAEIDTVLGHLAETVAALPQAVTQLGRILQTSRETHQLEMDGMTPTTDPDRAITTARLHLTAVRDTATATHHHINEARNQVAHIRAHSLDRGAEPAEDVDRDIAEETYPQAATNATWRREARQAPRHSGRDRPGPAR
jgi:hypothetical protein